jgi:hypothetical protein
MFIPDMNFKIQVMHLAKYGALCKNVSNGIFVRTLENMYRLSHYITVTLRNLSFGIIRILHQE